MPSLTPRPCSSSVHLDGDRRPPGAPTFRIKRSSPAPRDSEVRWSRRNLQREEPAARRPCPSRRGRRRRRRAPRGLRCGQRVRSCRWRRTERRRHRTERHDLRCRRELPAGRHAGLDRRLHGREPRRDRQLRPRRLRRGPHPVPLRRRRVRRQRRLPQGGRAHQGPAALRRRRRRGPGLHLADRRGLQPPGRHGPAARARDRRRHLPRQDHQVERPGDRRGQPRQDAAGPGHHPGPPLGRLGHHPELHRLPEQGRSRRLDGEAPPARGPSRAARPPRARPA